MIKKEDWPQRLSRFVENYEYNGFHWGKQDCVTYLGDAVKSMTGKDPVSFVRGEYENEREALKVMEKYGDDLAEFWSEVAYRNRFEKNDVNFSQRGDILLFAKNSIPFKFISGLCVGEKAIILGEKKLNKRKTIEAVKCWRVPNVK